eukprot:CAMPEP_0115254536 /NCGR_PEP_ID=MMETSP0270-20121206/45247_1 /TAXON_ID=71861 /ORGANISM="Scrippsiella trochoidea, Strain CCMP3099" /LENGTH=54 /DNA_ID=CAMNT_0002670093 /DNA_START=147 /DNA_END=308 /DNA_ORIENTATION=+
MQVCDKSGARLHPNKKSPCRTGPLTTRPRVHGTPTKSYRAKGVTNELIPLLAGF